MFWWEKKNGCVSCVNKLREKKGVDDFTFMFGNQKHKSSVGLGQIFCFNLQNANS